MVSGGPYGLEEILASHGYARTLWLLALVPLLWSVPVALVVGELSAALPLEGGHYAWVRRALGPSWGFQQAWLALLCSVFDMAIYPTLLVSYLAQLWPGLGDLTPLRPGWWLGLAAILIHRNPTRACCRGNKKLPATLVVGKTQKVSILMHLKIHFATSEPFWLLRALTENVMTRASMPAPTVSN